MVTHCPCLYASVLADWMKMRMNSAEIMMSPNSICARSFVLCEGTPGGSRGYDLVQLAVDDCLHVLTQEGELLSFLLPAIPNSLLKASRIRLHNTCSIGLRVPANELKKAAALQRLRVGLTVSSSLVASSKKVAKSRGSMGSRSAALGCA